MARCLLPTLSSPENIPYTLFFPHQKGVKCRLDEVATVWKSLAHRPPQIEDGRPADCGRVFSRHHRLPEQDNHPLQIDFNTYISYPNSTVNRVIHRKYLRS